MFDFVRNRGWFYLFSAVLILPGVLSLILPGGLNPGIDFTSGTLMTIQFQRPETIEQSDLRDAFSSLGHGEAIVQRASGESANTFVVRTRPLQQATTDASGQASTSERQRMEDALTQRFGQMQILNLDQVSALIAEEIVRYAIVAVAAASVFILLYLWWAFNKVTHPVRYGATAVMALVHDVLVVVGIFSILGRIFPAQIEIESTFIVAVLTVIGFSVHDTIVVFDRIRENFIRRPGDTFEDVVNHSLAQTMTRSLNTSLTVLLTLVVLLLFGGSTIFTFVLALLIGIGTGTYSSIFVASMLLVSWQVGDFRKLWPFGGGGSKLSPARA